MHYHQATAWVLSYNNCQAIAMMIKGLHMLMQIPLWYLSSITWRQLQIHQQFTEGLLAPQILLMGGRGKDSVVW